AKWLTFGVSHPTEKDPLWSTFVMSTDGVEGYAGCLIAGFTELTHARKLCVLNYATVFFVDVDTIEELRSRPIIHPSQIRFSCEDTNGGWEVVMRIGDSERRLCRFDGIQSREFTRRHAVDPDRASPPTAEQLKKQAEIVVEYLPLAVKMRL